MYSKRGGKRGRSYFQKPTTCCCDNPSGIGVIIASVCIQSTSINKFSSSSSRHDDLWSTDNWITKMSTFTTCKLKEKKKQKILSSKHSNYTAVLFSLTKQKKFPSTSVHLWNHINTTTNRHSITEHLSKVPQNPKIHTAEDSLCIFCLTSTPSSQPEEQGCPECRPWQLGLKHCSFRASSFKINDLWEEIKHTCNMIQLKKIPYTLP